MIREKWKKLIENTIGTKIQRGPVCGWYDFVLVLHQ